MSIFYKFSSSNTFDTLEIDGRSISSFELKNRIAAKLTSKKSQNLDFTLELTNAQTKRLYNDKDMVPANTWVIVKRVPLHCKITTPPKLTITQQETKIPCISKQDDLLGEPLFATPSSNDQQELTTEEERLNALFSKTFTEYMPDSKPTSNLKAPITPPPNYICHRCGKPGHFIKMCPTNGDPRFDIKKPAHGIPKSAIVKVTPDTPGAFLLKDGSYGIMVADEEAFKKNVHTTIEKSREVPESLKCGICKDVFKNAVLVPCCGNSFCDECITRVLVEETGFKCPECKKKIVLDNLIPNSSLRKSVEDFKKLVPLETPSSGKSDSPKHSIDENIPSVSVDRKSPDRKKKDSYRERRSSRSPHRKSPHRDDSSRRKRRSYERDDDRHYKRRRYEIKV